MRITAGRMKGRLLRSASDHRPTKDQVRLAVFNALAAHVPGARALDLFAGSGSLGLEAWSRGAAPVEFVEQEAGAFRALLANLKAFASPEEAGRLRGHREDALAFIARMRGRATYDLIFADPPYAHSPEHRNWAAETLAAIDEGGLLAPGGILVLELKDTQSLAQPATLRPFLDRTYGISRVVMCERPAAAEVPA